MAHMADKRLCGHCVLVDECAQVWWCAGGGENRLGQRSGRSPCRQHSKESQLLDRDRGDACGHEARSHPRPSTRREHSRKLRDVVVEACEGAKGVPARSEEAPRHASHSRGDAWADVPHIAGVEKHQELEGVRACEKVLGRQDCLGAGDG